MRMKEMIDCLEEGQQALREHVERKYDEVRRESSDGQWRSH